ncbi:MAG: hypothetical protein V7K27_11700 [Nostoc sp.]|uniref:hypothetical protein n=1 Tax=Nostoc sp. TaxID=1180 RepID=UPI002FFB63A1
MGKNYQCPVYPMPQRLELPAAFGESCKLVVKRVSTRWNNQLVLTLTIDSEFMQELRQNSNSRFKLFNQYACLSGLITVLVVDT